MHVKLIFKVKDFPNKIQESFSQFVKIIYIYSLKLIEQNLIDIMYNTYIQITKLRV